MKWRAKFLALWPLWIGCVAAVIGWLLVQGYTQQVQRDFESAWAQANPPLAMVDVVVFREPRENGHTVTINDLQYRTIPEVSIPSDVIFAADVDALVGLTLMTVHGTTIGPGHPLVWAYFKEMQSESKALQLVKFTLSLSPEHTHLGNLESSSQLLLYERTQAGIFKHLGAFPILALDGIAGVPDRAPRFVTIGMSLSERLMIEAKLPAGDLLWLTAPSDIPVVSVFGEVKKTIDFLVPGGKQCEHGCSPAFSAFSQEAF